MAELVVFYSLTGKSRQVAEWLAAGLNAEIEEIVEQRPRDFAFRGIFRSGLDSLLHRRPPIAPMAHREEIYDRVILACPVWGGRIAGPARTWLHRYGPRARSLGLALQSGDGAAYPAVLGEFEEMTGRTPKPLLTVSEADFGARTAERKVADFIHSITIEAAKFPAD
jgi:multimeric flavodoxin WrbA